MLIFNDCSIGFNPMQPIIVCLGPCLYYSLFWVPATLIELRECVKLFILCWLNLL